jgi:hypothetical protein
MENALSKDLAKLRADIVWKQQDWDNCQEGIDEMQGEMAMLEDEIEELETELDDLEKQALEDYEPIEICFSELAKGLTNGIDYFVERDPVMMRSWVDDVGSDVECCVLMTNGTVYSCVDISPAPDSLMTLTGKIAQSCRLPMHIRTKDVVKEGVGAITDGTAVGTDIEQHEGRCRLLQPGGVKIGRITKKMDGSGYVEIVLYNPAIFEKSESEGNNA